MPIAPINTVADAFNDPQVLHRNMLVEADHPLVGKYRMPGNPIKIGGSDGASEEFLPAPMLGQHSREVLGELLGYSEAEISSLEERGTI